MAAFLAQVAHESGGFNFVKEGLSYSAVGLNKTFKKYFPTVASAQPYARNPAKIANKVYANRMGNGPERSGDGYKHRGRGLIQLTGKDNYTRFAKSIDKTVDEAIAYLETSEGAVASAGWFWDVNKLNVYADKGDFVGLTRRINGGIIGLSDRKHHYQIALKALA
jgi:putative chitinase